MTTLNEQKSALLRTVIQSSPDKVLGDLEAMLAEGAAADPALGAIQRMVDRELRDRRIRDLVLDPLLPLCRAGGEFPPAVVGAIWRALRRSRAAELAELPDILADWRRDEQRPPEALDQLCLHALEGLRAGDAAFQPVAALAGERLALLEQSLQLAPVVRRASDRLGEFLARPGSERIAVMRLALRDAAALQEDGGPRLLHMLSLRLAEPWRILRVIKSVLDRPTDRFLAGSELGVFGERALAGIDDCIALLAAFEPQDGAAAARAAAQAVQEAIGRLTEIEDSLLIRPDGPWRPRMVKQRKTLAQAAEFWIREAAPLVEAALPLQQTRFAARMVKGVPRLSADPEPDKVARAGAVLAFLNEARSSAMVGGFGALRTRMIEKLADRMDRYIEDLLAELRADDCQHPERVRAFLDVAAGFLGLLQDEKAAQIVRRRTAAA